MHSVSRSTQPKHLTCISLGIIKIGKFSQNLHDSADILADVVREADEAWVIRA